MLINCRIGVNKSLNYRKAQYSPHKRGIEYTVNTERKSNKSNSIVTRNIKSIAASVDTKASEWNDGEDSPYSQSDMALKKSLYLSLNSIWTNEGGKKQDSPTGFGFGKNPKEVTFTSINGEDGDKLPNVVQAGKECRRWKPEIQDVKCANTNEQEKRYIST